MNNKGMENLVVKARRHLTKEQIKERVGLAKQNKNEQRSRARVKPFHELAAKNREIGDSAEELIALKTETETNETKSAWSETKSPWIVLKKGHAGEQDWVVGRVAKRRKNGVVLRYNNGPLLEPPYIHYEVAMHVVDEEEADIMRRSPGAYRGDVETTTLKAVEETYKIPDEDGFQDSISSIGSEHSPQRYFNPVGALTRLWQASRIEKSLGDLQETVQLFQTAANDEQLNPGIVRITQDQPQAA